MTSETMVQRLDPGTANTHGCAARQWIEYVLRDLQHLTIPLIHNLQSNVCRAAQRE
jgi:hypothetical protein